MDKDAQQKLMRFQVLETNLSMIRKRHEEALKRLEELELTKHTIASLKDLKASDALIPVGSNNFVQGKVEDSKSVIVGIGGGVAVRKKREDAEKIVDSHIKQIAGIIREFTKEEQDIVAELQKLQPELQKLSEGK